MALGGGEFGGEAFGASFYDTPAGASVAVSLGSWWGLVNILTEYRQSAAAEAARGPVACPNDGEPLVTGPDGRPFCRFDGWTPR